MQKVCQYVPTRLRRLKEALVLSRLRLCLESTLCFPDLGELASFLVPNLFLERPK